MHIKGYGNISFKFWFSFKFAVTFKLNLLLCLYECRFHRICDAREKSLLFTLGATWHFTDCVLGADVIIITMVIF